MHLKSWRRSRKATKLDPPDNAAASIRPEKTAAAGLSKVAASGSSNVAAPGLSNVAASGRSDVVATGSRGSSQLPRNIILIVGETGHGKSTFINHLLSTSGRQAQVGHGMRSVTEEMEQYITSDIAGRSYMLVDSPGSGNPYVNDDVVIKMIASWLEKTYRKGLSVKGIIFIKSIDEARMHRSSLKIIEMVRALCGDDALANVHYVTTHWDVVEHTTAKKREQELRERYLKDHLCKGAKLLRHHNTVESAMKIVKELADQPQVQLSIPRLLVVEKKHLPDTDVGALTSPAEKCEEDKSCEAAKAGEAKSDSQWTVKQIIDNASGLVGIAANVADILSTAGGLYEKWSKHQLSSKKMDADAAHDAATQRKEDLKIYAETARDATTQEYQLYTNLAEMGANLGTEVFKMWWNKS